MILDNSHHESELTISSVKNVQFRTRAMLGLGCSNTPRGRGQKIRVCKWQHFGKIWAKYSLKLAGVNILLEYILFLEWLRFLSFWEVHMLSQMPFSLYGSRFWFSDNLDFAYNCHLFVQLVLMSLTEFFDKVNCLRMNLSTLVTIKILKKGR